MQKDKKWVMLGVLVLLVAGFFVLRATPLLQKDTDSSENAKNPQSNEPTKSPFAYISGEPAKPGLDSNLAKRRVLAVMIENHPDSRPQSGLSQAEVVYEVVAEGGITRFLAIFQRDGVNLGPIRSARTYYAELADMWQGLFVHVGGSPSVLRDLKAKKYGQLVDVNEYYQGEYFERIKSRSAPHNVYTTTTKLFEYAQDQSLEMLDVPPSLGVEYVESVVGGVPFEQGVDINFSKPEFLVQFNYDLAQKKYLRSIAGMPDVDDGNGQRISPSSVLVMKTDINEIPGDAEGRMDVRTDGKGQLMYYTAGQQFTGEWSRSPGGSFQFRDSFGQPIKLLPGQVWIAIVPN